MKLHIYLIFLLANSFLLGTVDWSVCNSRIMKVYVAFTCSFSGNIMSSCSCMGIYFIGLPLFSFNRRGKRHLESYIRLSIAIALIAHYCNYEWSRIEIGLSVQVYEPIPCTTDLDVEWHSFRMLMKINRACGENDRYNCSCFSILVFSSISIASERHKWP